MRGHKDSKEAGDGASEPDVPAVAYVRMSTDHQKYSTENQLDVIRNRALRQAHPRVMAEIIAGVTRRGGSAVQNPETDLVRVNDEFTMSIVLARCTATAAGSLRWRIRLDTGLVPDITIAVRMDEVNEAPHDYYVLPSIDMTFGKLKFAEQNGLALDAYRFDTLDFFYALASRARIAEVA